MQKTDCPYCSLAIKKGELFCSRHGSAMEKLKSGVFYINTASFDECDWHVTRLSLNFNLDEKQVYHAGPRAFTVSPEKYLLLNEGQSFRTSARGSTKKRMVTIAFQVGLAEKLLQGLRDDDHRLLDDPFHSQNSKTHFLEKTYPLNSSIFSTVTRLTQINDAAELDQSLEDLLLEIVQGQMSIRKEILSIKKSKASTRFEVYKRLHWSLDYLHENFASDITVEQLARVACLSTFHYKRLFSEVFKISPYQYLIRLRLETACVLLKSDRKVSEICQHVGWKDPSSFTRLFKRQFFFTPEQFRNRAVSTTN
jgi:AraC family transcriptional regulator